MLKFYNHPLLAELGRLRKILPDRPKILRGRFGYFNHCFRLIGVDKEALNHQVGDRNQRQQMDQQRHEAYAREMIKNDKLGVLYQERQERDVRDLQKVLKNIGFLSLVYDTP